MVVNAMIVAMVAHADQRGSETIYQVGSSVSNPLEITNLKEYGFNYFRKYPWINKVDGKPIIVGQVTMLSTMDSFRKYMAFHYLLPLKGLEIVNTACCQYFQGKYLELYRKIKFVMRLIDLYGPYLFFKSIFDDLNTEKLRIAARDSGVDADVFYFDPKTINWEDYFMKIHLPGVVRYVFK
nr:PREDICTED: alcohol-forming fatty acyl-CoA reductase-like [Nicotiana tabacum]